MNNFIERSNRIALIVLLSAIAILSLGCHRTNAGSAKRYPFTGRVISIDTKSETALIDGDMVQGFMEAMAMSYKIKPASTLRQLAPGDAISAEVVVIEPDPENRDAETNYWLEKVNVTAHAKAPPAAGANAMHIPQAGEDVPDFSFTNQDGKRISLRQYRGKVLLVTFIYTRCPFPDFCPRMSSNFAEIYRHFGYAPTTHLLSISFDPEHDTPKVLREYGFSAAKTHDAALFRNWEFAAPRAADLPKIADFFALTVKPEGGMITHNLSTAVIGPDGKIFKWYHGSEWTVSDLMNDADQARAPKS